MILSRVKIAGFRAYNEEVTIPIYNLTSIVGKNDAGKSSVFSALDSFFNETKRDIEDVNKEYGEKSFIVTCCFKDLPKDEIVIDTSSRTTLEKEWLLNKDNELEISKEYKFGATSQSLKPDVYIIAQQPNISSEDPLHTLTLPKLRALAETYDIDKEKIKDARTCTSYRAAIWQLALDKGLEAKTTKIAVNKEDAKKIYGQLETYLPAYILFNVDRESLDSDTEVKDPLQAAAKESLTNYEDKVSKIYEQVVSDVEEVAARTVDKLKELHPDLASNLTVEHAKKPEIKFDFSLKDERGIRINKRGSGTRRMILLSFLRAQAEKPQRVAKDIIYAIEEPESSQHPNNQALIVKSLMSISEQPNRQVLLTSHIPKMVEFLPMQSIIFIEQGTKNNVSVYGGEDALRMATESLGVLGDLPKISPKAKVIFVEGVTDETFLEKLWEVLKSAGKVSQTFHDLGHVVIPQNGKDSVKKWALNNWASKALESYAYFLDSDKKSGEDTTDNLKFRDDCMKKSVACVCTQRREIENYINPKTIERMKSRVMVIDEFEDAKAKIERITKIPSDQIINCFWKAATEEEILEGPIAEFLTWYKDLA